MSAPQFGDPEPGRTYRDRPAAFGIVERGGQIALVRIEKPNHPAWIDLPGGALDPGEDAGQAVVREFGEEAGLKVAPGEAYAHADQRFINTDGEAFNNRGTFFTLTLRGRGRGPEDRGRPRPGLAGPCGRPGSPAARSPRLGGRGLAAPEALAPRTISR